MKKLLLVIPPAFIFTLLLVVTAAAAAAAAAESAPAADASQQCVDRSASIGKKVSIGAYYFDGWSGRNLYADDPNESWARNAPTHLSKRMVTEFPQRQPIWGWRDDSLEIMERQIALAADHGIDFFAFCWYWHDDAQAINEQAIKEDPKHCGLELFLKSSNNNRLKFCLLIANHGGSEIRGTLPWKQAADFWMPYLKHPRYLTVDGKPLIIIFIAGGGDQEGFAYLQEAARRAGLPGVAIAGCGSIPEGTGYTHSTHYNIIPGYTSGHEEHKYAELVAAHQRRWRGTSQRPFIPEITAGWDKRPWEGPTGLNQPEGWYYPDRSPEQFAGFLRDAVTWMDEHPQQTTAERIILIYAWNEFGEGGYLAPTLGDPNGAYLSAIRSVVIPELADTAADKKPAK